MRKKNGYTNIVHYTDDGWSGASFDRPSWKNLIKEIKDGKVSTVIIKDMSRVGHDYLQVGFYTEVMFREKGVHFIAISNGVDSDKGESAEFAPFLNIMNEWYVRDTSRKITTEINNVEHCMEFTKRYTDFTELTAPMINEFVSKIIIHKAEGKGADRTQEVEIYLNYVGKIELPQEQVILSEEELLQQEKERIRLEKKRASNRKYMARKREEIRRQQEKERSETAVKGFGERTMTEML